MFCCLTLARMSLKVWRAVRDLCGNERAHEEVSASNTLFGDKTIIRRTAGQNKLAYIVCISTIWSDADDWVCPNGQTVPPSAGYLKGHQVTKCPMLLVGPDFVGYPHSDDAP